MNEGEPKILNEMDYFKDPYKGIGDHYRDGERIVKKPVRNTIQPVEGTLKVEQATSPVQKPE